MSEESLFLAALEKNAPAEREAFLNEACGTDRALRARVQLLLDADARARGILDQPPAVGLEATRAFSPQEEVGAVIAGRYKLLEAIGEGGMGTVWVAEQTEPVRRKVAMKLIKAGMDSRSVLARFEAERQALAVMDHPNIAKVLDGGLTETGRPFFVMEYVKGVPITEYCDTARLSVPERLNLFMRVCQAVQHAHHKGIIHRDLKPSNILVAPYDDRPVPKVIDFGLAKAMHQSLTERTLHTAHETVLGTPLYMSPEQAQLNNLDVDTRSDIYSLGVLLYELLTGTTPLEKQRFKQAAWDEVKRIIREEDPPRPSLRLSSADTLPSLAAGRQIEPARLTKLVRGELDWIVMKSLEKDRSRRYETANGFAMDIQRYLSGEPVLAAPPSARYRLQKFVRKNRASLTTAASIVTLLVAGAAISSWQAVRATRAEAAARRAAEQAVAAQRAEAERAAGERQAKLDAEAKQAEAERQQVRAEAGEKLASDRLSQVDAEKQNAEEEKQIATAVLNFLQNKLLRQADVQMQADTLLQSGGVEAVTEIDTNPTIRTLLDRAARELTLDRIDASFPNQPRVQAAVLQTVGRTYSAVGEREQALDFLNRSLTLQRQTLGAQHADTLYAMSQLALVYRKANQWDLAIPLYQEILDLRKATLGPDHPDTIAVLNGLAATYTFAGNWEQALPLCEENYERAKATLGPRHRITLQCLQNLANALNSAGQQDRGLLLQQELLSAKTATLGAIHPETLVSRNNLAVAYLKVGKRELALPLCEETLKLYQATLGPDHPSTLIVMSNLAIAYRWANLPDLAAALDEQTLRLRRAKLGTDDPDTLKSLNNLAAAYGAAKKMDQAVPLYEEALQLTKAKQGPEHPETLAAMKTLASAYQATGQFDRSISQYEELIKLQSATLGHEHPETLAAKWKLGEHYRPSDGYYSIPMLEEVWNVRKRTLPEGDKVRINTQNLLGMVLSFAGRYAEAETHLLASYRDLSSSQDANPSSLMSYSRRLVYLYAEWDKPAELAQWRAELKKLAGPDRSPLDGSGHLSLFRHSQFRAAEAVLADHLAFCERTHSNSWVTDNARFLLGCALLGQNKFTDAEPLLLAGYAGIKLRESKVPPDTRLQLSEMVEWLVRHYEGLDQKDEAAKWRLDGEKLSTTRYEDLLTALNAQLGPRHPDTIAMTSTLANIYRDGGDLPRAVPLFEQLWEAAKHNRPEGDKVRIDTQNHLGYTLLLAGRLAEAEPHLLASYEDALKAPAFPKDWQLVYVVRLVSLYAELDKPDEVVRWRVELQKFGNEAETWLAGTGSRMLSASRFQAAEQLLRDCLALRERVRPDDWRTFESKSLLGGALLGQNNTTAAEPLLLAGYEGLKQRTAKIPPDHQTRLIDAVDRLVRFYEMIGDKEKAVRWRNELETRRFLKE